MAVIDFPTSPTNGQIFNASNGVTYRWQSTPAPGLWLSGSGVASVSAGTTPPASPAPNALWWNSDAITGGGQLYVYYNDGNTAQWVPAATGSLPTTPGGDFFAMFTGADFGTTASFATVVCNTVLSGNATGSYSTSTGRFTPPAGRYHLFATTDMYTASGTLVAAIQLRKNGIAIGPPSMQQMPANSWHQVITNQTADANGTDWFDIQINSGGAGAANHCSFGAYPISGIKGPPGDPAPTGMNLIQTQNVTTPVASLTFDIPSTANNIHFIYNLRPSLNAVSLVMRTAGADGVIDVGASDYITTNNAAFTNNSFNGGTQTAAWLLLTGISNNISNSPGWAVSGDGTFNDIQSSLYTMGTYKTFSLEAAATLMMTIVGGLMRVEQAPITKIQFLFSGGNIESGRVSVYGGQ